MVVIHLQEGKDVLVKPLVVQHLHEAVLIPRHGDIGVKAEAGIQGRVVTLNPLIPTNEN